MSNFWLSLSKFYKIGHKYTVCNLKQFWGHSVHFLLISLIPLYHSYSEWSNRVHQDNAIKRLFFAVSRVYLPFLCAKHHIKIDRNKIDQVLLIYWKTTEYLSTVAAPLIAALDYWPLSNRGRKNRGLNNIFWLEAAFE